MALVKDKRMTQKETLFEAFIQEEGDTAQEAVHEEIPFSSCQINRLGHSSSVMHNVEGKTHKLLEKLKRASRKCT